MKITLNAFGVVISVFGLVAQAVKMQVQQTIDEKLIIAPFEIVSANGLKFMSRVEIAQRMIRSPEHIQPEEIPAIIPEMMMLGTTIFSSCSKNKRKTEQKSRADTVPQ